MIIIIVIITIIIIIIIIIFIIIISLSLFRLDSSFDLTSIAGFNPGSWALVGGHVLYIYSIDKTFLRMWTDPDRAIFCSSVVLMFPRILLTGFSVTILDYS